MPRRRVTDEEREIVRAFVLALYERWQPEDGKRSYAEFARRAGVSETSFATWRAGPGAKKRATPEALDLMKMLRAVGVVNADFGLHPGELAEEPVHADAGAQRAAALAEAERRAQDTRRTA